MPRSKRTSPTKVDPDTREGGAHQKTARGKVKQQAKTVDARTSNSDGIVGARGAKGWNAPGEAGDQVQVRTSASENQVSVQSGSQQRPRKTRNRKANEEENKDKGKSRGHSIRTSVTTLGEGDGQSKKASTHQGDGEMTSNATISIIGRSQRKDTEGVKETVQKPEDDTLPVTRPQAEQGEQGKEIGGTKTGKLITIAKNIWTFLTPQPPKRKIRPPRPKYSPKSQPWHTARIFELKMREKNVDLTKKGAEAAAGKRKIVKKEYIEMDQFVSKKAVKNDKVVEVLHARVTRKTSKGFMKGETVNQEMIVEKVAARKKSPAKKDMKSGDAALEVDKGRYRQIEERASRSKFKAHFDRGDTQANQDVEKGKRLHQKKRGVIEEKVESTKADSKTRPIVCPKECPRARRAVKADELSMSKARGSSKTSIKSTSPPEKSIKETKTRDENKRQKSKTRGDAEQRIKSKTSLTTDTKEKELKVRKKRQKSPERDASEQVESKRKKTKRDDSKPKAKSTLPTEDDYERDLEEVAEETRIKSQPRHASKPKAKSTSPSVKEVREPKVTGGGKRKKSKPREAFKSNFKTISSVGEDNIRETVKCAGETCTKSKTRDASKPKVKPTPLPSVADNGEQKEIDEGAHKKSKKQSAPTPPAKDKEKSDKFIEVKCTKLKSLDSSKSKMKSTSHVVEKENKHNKSKYLQESTSPPVEKIKFQCVKGTCKKSKSRDSSRSQLKSNLPSDDEEIESLVDEEEDMPSERPSKPSRVYGKYRKGEVDKIESKSSFNKRTSNDKTSRKIICSLLEPNNRKTPQKLVKETRSKSKKQTASSLPPAEDVNESGKSIKCKEKKSKSRDSSTLKPTSISPSVEEVRESTKCDGDNCRKSKSNDGSSKKLLKSAKSPTKEVKLQMQNKERKSKTRDSSEHSVKSSPSPLKETKHEDEAVVEKDSKCRNRKKPYKPTENSISVEVSTTLSKRGIEEVYKTRSKSSDNQLGRKVDEKPLKVSVSTRRLKREQSKKEMLGSSTEEETKSPSERPRKPLRVQGKEYKGEERQTHNKTSSSVLPPNNKTGRKSSSNVLAPNEKKSPHKLAKVTEIITIKSKGNVNKIKSRNVRTLQTCGQVNDSEEENIASEPTLPSSDEIDECECQNSKLSEQILRDIREEAKRLNVLTPSAYRFLRNLNERISVWKENVKRSKSVDGVGKRMSSKSSVTKKRNQSAGPDVTTSKNETCPKFEAGTSFRNLQANDIECGCDDKKFSEVNKSTVSKPSAMAKERVEKKGSQIKGSSSKKESVRRQRDQNNAFAALGDELLITLRNDPRLLQNLDALIEAIRTGTPYKGIPSNEVDTPKESSRPKANSRTKSIIKHNLKAEMKSELEKLEEETDECSDANKESKLQPEEQPGGNQERAQTSPEVNMPSGESFQNKVECDIFSIELPSCQKKLGRYMDDSCLERWREMNIKSAEGPRPVTKTKSARDGGPPTSNNRYPRFAQVTAPVSSHKISSGKRYKQHGQTETLEATETQGDVCEKIGDWVMKLAQPVTSKEIKKAPIERSEEKPNENVNSVQGLRNFGTDVRSCFGTSWRKSNFKNSSREPVEEISEGKEISNRRRSCSQVKVKKVTENGRNCSSGIAVSRVVNADIHVKAVDICKRIMKNLPLKGSAFDKLYDNIVNKLLKESDLASAQVQGFETETLNSASPRSTSQDQSYGRKSITYRPYHHKRYCNAVPRKRQLESKNKKKLNGKFRPKNRNLSQDGVSSLLSSELNNTKTSAHRIASNRRIRNKNGLLSKGIKVKAQSLDTSCQQINTADTNCSTLNRQEKDKYLMKLSEWKDNDFREVKDLSLNKTKYKSMVRNKVDVKSKDGCYHDNGSPTYSEFSGNPMEEDQEEDLERLVSASELRNRTRPRNNALQDEVEQTRNFHLSIKDSSSPRKICTPRDVEKETKLKDRKNLLQISSKRKDVLKKKQPKEMRSTQVETRDIECQTIAMKRNSTPIQGRLSSQKERSNMSENFRKTGPAQDTLICMRAKVPSASKPFQKNRNIKNTKASCNQILPLGRNSGVTSFVQNTNNEEIVRDKSKEPDECSIHIDSKNNAENETKRSPKDKRTTLDCNDHLKKNKFVSALKSVSPKKIAKYLTVDRKLQQDKKGTSTRPTTACTSKDTQSKSKNRSKAFVNVRQETINYQEEATPTNATTSKNDNQSSKFPNNVVILNETVSTETQTQPSDLFRSKTFTFDDEDSLRFGENKLQASDTQKSKPLCPWYRAKSAGLYSFRTSVKESRKRESSPSYERSQQINLGHKIRADGPLKSSRGASKLSKEDIAQAKLKPTKVKNSNSKYELGKMSSTGKGQVDKLPWRPSLRKRSKTNINRLEAEKTPQIHTRNNKHDKKLQTEALPSSTERKIITPRPIPFANATKKATMRDVYKTELALNPTAVATDPMLVKQPRVEHIYTVKLSGNPSSTDCRLKKGTSIKSKTQGKSTQHYTLMQQSTKCVNQTGAEITPLRAKLRNEQFRSKSVSLKKSIPSNRIQQAKLAIAEDNQVFQKNLVEQYLSTIKNKSQDRPGKENYANNPEYLRTRSHSSRRIHQGESSTIRVDTKTRASSREIQQDTSLDNASGQISRSLELPRSQKLVPNQQSTESSESRDTGARPSKPNPATRRLPRVPSNIIRSHSFLELPRSVSRSYHCLGSKNFSKANAKFKPVDPKVFASPVKIEPSHMHKVVDARELTSQISNFVHVEPKAGRESKKITKQNSNYQKLNDTMACAAKKEHEIEKVICSKVNQEKQRNLPLKSQTEWMKTAEEKQLWWEKHGNGFETTVLKAPDKLTNNLSSTNRAPKNFVKRNIKTSSCAATIAERNRESAKRSTQRWHNRISTQYSNSLSQKKQMDEENVSPKINITIHKRKEIMENGQEMIDVNEDVSNNRQMLSTNGSRNEISRESRELDSSMLGGTNIKEDVCVEIRDNKRVARIDQDDQTRQETSKGKYEQNNYDGKNVTETGLKSTGAIPKYRGNGDTNHPNFICHVDSESVSAASTDMTNNHCDLEYQDSDQNVTMDTTPRVNHGYQPNSNNAGLIENRSKYICDDSDDNISNCESCEKTVKHHEQQRRRGDKEINYETREEITKRHEQQMGRQDNKAKYNTREEITKHYEQQTDRRDNKAKFETNKEMLEHHKQQTGHRDPRSNYETCEEIVKHREQQRGDQDNNSNYERREDMAKFREQQTGRGNKSYTCIRKEEYNSSIVDSGILVKKFNGNRGTFHKQYSIVEESEGSGSSASSIAENIDSGILGTSQRTSPFKECSSATVDTSNTSRENTYAGGVCRSESSASTTSCDSSCVSTDENSSATQDDSARVSKSSGSLEQCSNRAHNMREGEPPKPKERQMDKANHFHSADVHGDYVEVPVLKEIQPPNDKHNKNDSVNLITPSSEDLLAQAVGSRKLSRERETLKQFCKTVQIPHGPRPPSLNVEDLDQYQDIKPDKGRRVLMGSSQAKVTHIREPVIRMPTIHSENNGRAMKRDVAGRAVRRPTTPRGLKASKEELSNKPPSRQPSPAKPIRSPSSPPRNPPSNIPNKQPQSQHNKSSSMRADSLGRNNGHVLSGTRPCKDESVNRISNHYERDSVAVKSNVNDGGCFYTRTDMMSTTLKAPKMLQITNCSMENNTKNMIETSHDRELNSEKFTLSEDEAFLKCFYDESKFVKTRSKKEEEIIQELEKGVIKYNSGNVKEPSNAKNKAEKEKQTEKRSSRHKVGNDENCIEESRDAIKKIDSVVTELDRKNDVKKRFASFVSSTPEKHILNGNGKQPCHVKRNTCGANACFHEITHPEETSQRADRSSMGTSAKNFIEIIKAPQGTSDSECSHCSSSTFLVCDSEKHTSITSKLAKTMLTSKNGHNETVHYEKSPQTPKGDHKDSEHLKNFGRNDKRTLETVSKKSETRNQAMNSPVNVKQLTVGNKKEINVENHMFGKMTSSNSKVLDTVYKNNSCDAPSEEVLEVSCDQNSKLFQILTKTAGNGEVKNFLLVDNCLKEIVIVDNAVKFGTKPSAEVEMESISGIKTNGTLTCQSDGAKRTEVSLNTQKSAVNFVPVNENSKDNKRREARNSLTKPYPDNSEEQVNKGKTRTVANVTIEKRNKGPFEAELHRESSGQESSEDDESSSSSECSEAIQQSTEPRSSNDSEQLLGTRRKSDLDKPWSLATNLNSPVRSRTVNVISHPNKTREWVSNESSSRSSSESSSVSSRSDGNDTSSEIRMKSPPNSPLPTRKVVQHSHSSFSRSEESSDLIIKPKQSMHTKQTKNSKDDQSQSITSEENVLPASKERMTTGSSLEGDLFQLTSSTIELIDSGSVILLPSRSNPENISAVEIQRKTSASRGTMTEETSTSTNRTDSEHIREHSVNTLSPSGDDRKYSLDTLKNSDDARKQSDDTRTFSTGDTITLRMMSLPVSREILSSSLSSQTDRSEARETIPANNRTETQRTTKQYTVTNENISISKKSEEKFSEHCDDLEDELPTSKPEKKSEMKRRKSSDNKSIAEGRPSDHSTIGIQAEYQPSRESSKDILNMIYETDKQKFEDQQSYSDSLFLNDDTFIDTDSQEYDMQINKKYATDPLQKSKMTQKVAKDGTENDFITGHFKARPKKKDNVRVKNSHPKKGDSGTHKIFTQVGRWIGKKIDKI